MRRNAIMDGSDYFRIPNMLCFFYAKVKKDYEYG